MKSIIYIIFHSIISHKLPLLYVSSNVKIKHTIKKKKKKQKPFNPTSYLRYVTANKNVTLD